MEPRKIAIAIQGGAMRSIYCLGAVRALVEAGHAAEVRSLHVASAGCVSGAVLASLVANPAGPQISEITDRLLDALAGKRFINSRRFRKVVDVDYLVDTIFDVTALSAPSLRRSRITFEVGVTDFKCGVAKYLNLADPNDDNEIRLALRGTMAIPLLYPPHVTIGGTRYVDGGITDPLPMLRALRRNPDICITISSVAAPNLGRELEGRESMLVRFLPGLSAPVRHLLLGRNPLGAAVEELSGQSHIGGVQLIKIAPKDQSKLGHRLETDRNKLLALEQLGYDDGRQALAVLKERVTAPV
jgi:predicted patatin/cPLA2 family phospholipase